MRARLQLSVTSCHSSWSLPCGFEDQCQRLAANPKGVYPPRRSHPPLRVRGRKPTRAAQQCGAHFSSAAPIWRRTCTDSEFGLLQFVNGAWTDALGRMGVQQDLGVGFLSTSCPLTPGFRLYRVEMVATGDAVDSKKRQEIKGLPLTR